MSSHLGFLYMTGKTDAQTTQNQAERNFLKYSRFRKFTDIANILHNGRDATPPPNGLAKRNNAISGTAEY